MENNSDIFELQKTGHAHLPFIHCLPDLHPAGVPAFFWPGQIVCKGWRTCLEGLCAFL
jgi:hypothetical protein